MRSGEDAFRLRGTDPAPASVSAPGSAGGARGLALLAMVVAGVLLPVAMTVANRSSPLILGLAAVLMNGAAFRAGRAGELGRSYLALVRGRSGLFVLGGIGLAAASLLWSVDRTLSLRGLREALPEIVFAWCFAAAGRCVARRSDVAALRYGLLLASATILLEALFGMPLHHLVHVRAEPYDLKWSALTLALLVWPAVDGEVRRGAWPWPAVVIAAVAAASVAAHSATALCAVGISILVLALAVWAPRAALFGFAAFLLAALIVPPWFGQLAGAMVTPRLRVTLEQQHAEHRIEIWTAFGRRIGERFWLGHGVNTSFDIGRPDHPDEESIVNRHPHNAFLQVWIELGVVGVVGLAAAIVHLMARLRILPTRLRATRLAQLGVVTVLGLVWENPWRPWWLAAVGLGAALFLLERSLPDDDPRGPGNR